MLPKTIKPEAFKAGSLMPLHGGLRLSPVKTARPLPGLAAQTTVGTLDSRLTIKDRLGRLAVLWGIGRNHYRFAPGLYKLGSPDRNSPVLVTSNYKFTVDVVRHDCAGIDAWLLVLNTRGINVWCAAGKGTFGSAELVQRIASTGLAAFVEHRRLILPQLGAPGVSAPEVLAKSGWRIIWGPVRAADIPAFLAAGQKKTEAMRTVNFGLRGRLQVAPMEMRQSWPILALAVVLALFAVALERAGKPANPSAVFLSIAGIWLSGSLAFPLLLPFWPGKAFAVKGLLPGLVWGLAASWLFSSGWLFGAALTLASVSTVSFLAMNFTGASTFTSQTGALLEVDKAIVPQAVAILLALLAAIAGLVLSLKGIII
jgi:hypothetical protein